MDWVEKLVRPRREAAKDPAAALWEADPDPRGAGAHGRGGAGVAEWWAQSWHDPDSRNRLLLFCGLVGMVWVLFHFQGNTLDVPRYSRSMFYWFWFRWNHGDGSDGHGPVVALVSLWLIWRKREEILAAPKRSCGLGLGLVAVALALHWVGLRGQLTRLSAFAFLLLVWGLILYVWGWRVARITFFPIWFLFFVIPLNFLDTAVAVRMRMLASVVAGDTLQALGVDVVREGTQLFFQASDGTARFRLDVAPACSGIRSLIALTALTAVYAYLTQDRLWKQLVLFLSAIPLAVIGNVIRVTSLGLIAEAFGQEIMFARFGKPLSWIAEDLHELSGFVFFAVAIVLMFLIGALLETNWKETTARWRESLTSPSPSASA